MLLALLELFDAFLSDRELSAEDQKRCKSLFSSCTNVVRPC